MKILISGAGIAGLTLAYWLEQAGHAVELIEKRNHEVVENGYIIYFWGAGLEVADRMGILPLLKAADHQVPALEYHSNNGNVLAEVCLKKLRKKLNDDVCIMKRGDLLRSLLSVVQSTISYHTEIAQLDENENSVSVRLSNGKQAEYDLVIGADGVYSRVRELVFGDESKFIQPLGYFFGVFIQPLSANLKSVFHAYAMPDKTIAVFPLSTSTQAAFFIFKNKNHIDYDQQVFASEFKRAGWIVPRLLNNLDTAQEKYLDHLVQVNMPQWYRGRVALVGDACQCLSLTSGMGASMAMTGAYMLAHALKSANNRHEQAFYDYQQFMKPEIDRKQKAAKRFLRTFIPATNMGIFIRNILAKHIQSEWISRFLFKGLLKQRLTLPAMITSPHQAVHSRQDSWHLP